MTLVRGDGEANVIFSSEPLPPEMGAGEYARSQVELQRRECTGYRQSSFGEESVFGDRRGYVHSFEWLPPDGLPIVQTQAYFVHGGRGYVGTATCPAASLARLRAELMAVLAGLRIEAGNGGGRLDWGGIAITALIVLIAGAVFAALVLWAPSVRENSPPTVTVPVPPLDRDPFPRPPDLTLPDLTLPDLPRDGPGRGDGRPPR